MISNSRNTLHTIAIPTHEDIEIIGSTGFKGGARTDRESKEFYPASTISS
jgi:hypothetical protein